MPSAAGHVRRDREAGRSAPRYSTGRCSESLSGLAGMTAFRTREISGVMPIQQPIAVLRMKVIQYLGSFFHVSSTTLGLILAGTP
jgi:hypothetical protein